MSPTVFLHVGAPKTGTTYLQDRLARNAASLTAHGIHFPSTSPLVSAPLSHFRAALDLLGQDWGGPPGHADGAWPALVRAVRRKEGTVVVSHEILAPAPPEQVARAMADLGPDVHIVYTARDLARQVPAAWQESIKQGRSWTYARFARRTSRGRTWPAQAFDVPSVLSTWGTHVPPENIHLVTVPARRDHPVDDDLWHRFCRVVGIDPQWAPEPSTRTNVSLGVAETDLLRRLNKRLGRTVRGEVAYDGLVRALLAEDVLVQSRSSRITVAPDDFSWITPTADTWIEWAGKAGIDVVGDLEDLRCVAPDASVRWRDPDKVPAGRRARVAVAALAAMTDEAARRPDPDGTLRGRLRRRSSRFRFR